MWLHGTTVLTMVCYLDIRYVLHIDLVAMEGGCTKIVHTKIVHTKIVHTKIVHTKIVHTCAIIILRL